MRLMITDSGLGGLSVCAGLERKLVEIGGGKGLELLYVNATPHDLKGYNSLSTQAERIELFDQFLNATNTRFSPDQIVIACNTLSVIYDETKFSKENPPQVLGIVNAGVQLSDQSLKDDPDTDLIVFATETTTEANTYPQLIRAGTSRVVAQACPDLAHAISNDSSGGASRRLIKQYAQEALEKFPNRPAAVFAFLACTHYGYQSNLFCEELEALGMPATSLDPNDLLVDQILDTLKHDDRADDNPMTIRFISRYAIPEVAIHAMESYLTTSAPQTLSALRNQEVNADLFHLP